MYSASLWRAGAAAAILINARVTEICPRLTSWRAWGERRFILARAGEDHESLDGPG